MRRQCQALGREAEGMKPQRIRELVSAGMGGDVSGWEPCPERVGDGPARRLPVGDWFTLGRSSEGTVLYYDDGFSMEMAVDSYGPEGTFSGPGCEVVFGAFGGRRTHIEPDREELERFMRLTFYRAPSVLDGGFTFMLSDELALHVTDVVEGAVRRFRCDVSYTSSDGKVSMEASGDGPDDAEGVQGEEPVDDRRHTEVVDGEPVRGEAGGGVGEEARDRVRAGEAQAGVQEHEDPQGDRRRGGAVG